jgi:formate hydrogenlyase subunit 4
VPILPDWAVQVLQVVTILSLAPLVSGLIARAEAIVQQRRGPRSCSPTTTSSSCCARRRCCRSRQGPVFRAAPYVSFAAYATIPLLIPALTTFPLPLGYMADFFGVGLILALASFVGLARRDRQRQPLRAARLEPAALVRRVQRADRDLRHVRAGADDAHRPALRVRRDDPLGAVEVVRPSHLLMIAAFFMLVLNETGRIPVENHGGTLEFGQIEEGASPSTPGPGLAFLRWGSNVKQLLLFTIFMNVLVVPWGLASSGRLDVVALAIGCCSQGARRRRAVVVIESSFAKLRLYKIPEFTVASFMLAVLAVVIFLFEPAFGDLHLSVFGAAATITAVVVLLLELYMLRSQEVWEQLHLYALASTVVAALAFAPPRPGTAAARSTRSARSRSR